jgi:hypothetical protein
MAQPNRWSTHRNLLKRGRVPGPTPGRPFTAAVSKAGQPAAPRRTGA